MRLLRTSTPTRASRVPFGVLSAATSTVLSLSPMPAPPTAVLVPYSGSKQPAVRPASASASSIPEKRGSLDHDIDDPLRDDNDLFRAFAVEGLFYLIEGQNGSLNLRLSSVPRHSDLGALFTVDLDRQGHGVFDQQIRLELRPSLGGDQRLMAKGRPAFLGQMRHHRVEQPHQDVAGFPQRPGRIGGGRGLCLLYTSDAA